MTKSTFAIGSSEGCKRKTSRLRRQFVQPRGLLGSIVGWLLAIKNRERSEWVVSLLDVQPTDHVLEVGFGPGVDIRRVSAIAIKGLVAGVDHSDVMLRQARKRNPTAIRAGRVNLQLGTMAKLPHPAESFDKVFGINAFEFSDDPLATLQEFRRVLKPGGLLAIAIQPRSQGATVETSRKAGRDLVAAFESAGLRGVHLESKDLKPVPVICALGTKV